MASNYAGGQYKEYTAMLRQRMSELPSFCAEFFRGIENETLVRISGTSSVLLQQSSRHFRVARSNPLRFPISMQSVRLKLKCTLRMFLIIPLRTTVKL